MNAARLVKVAWVLGVCLVAGCAGVPPRPTVALQVTVTPDTIQPGDIVSLRVDAPEGSKNLNGRLGVSGSPVLPLRSTDNGKTWTFVTQIPLGVVWQPGRYKVEIRGTGPGGEPLYGEAWITAP